MNKEGQIKKKNHFKFIDKEIEKYMRKMHTSNSLPALLQKMHQLQHLDTEQWFWTHASHPSNAISSLAF